MPALRVEGSMKDLILDKEHKKGSSGQKVRLIQEWLNLHGFRIKIDGDFGAITESSVRQFQRRNELMEDGVVGNNTFDTLVRPMRRALEPINIVRGHTTLGSLITAYAQLHLEQHPREVGGQNRGPWVRLYMDGNEGDAWPWCAGFVSFIIKQACRTIDIPVPIPLSFSCDELAAHAKRGGIFVAEGTGVPASGSLFLVRKTPTDWTHTGIVTHAQSEMFHTIEGNTNDEGHREGYEACARVRGYRDIDFVVWR